MLYIDDFQNVETFYTKPLIISRIAFAILQKAYIVNHIVFLQLASRKNAKIQSTKEKIVAQN